MGELIAAARKDFTLPTFQAVDDFETEVVHQADAWMAKLQEALLDAQHAKSDLDSQAARRKLQLLVVMTLGSTILLAANLLSEKPAESADLPPTPAETAAAERLVALAMEEANAVDEAASIGNE